MQAKKAKTNAFDQNSALTEKLQTCKNPKQLADSKLKARIQDLSALTMSDVQATCMVPTKLQPVDLSSHGFSPDCNQAGVLETLCSPEIRNGWHSNRRR
jgi:hypothetical protein